MPTREPDEPEARTRKLRIDKRLKDAGWNVVAFKPGKTYDRCAVEEFETANGPADYALVVDGGVIGIVEGKKRAVGPQNALSQASRYSKGVTDSPYNFDGFRVPFLYSSNGDDRASVQ